MIRLRGRRPTAEIRAFVRWLETVIEVKHAIEIHLTPHLVGYFDAPGKYAGYEPYIVAEMDDALHTIAHEMVHYEQWRDKRDQDERGVEQRGQALVRQWRRTRA